jgi:hypothetical protein
MSQIAKTGNRSSLGPSEYRPKNRTEPDFRTLHVSVMWMDARTLRLSLEIMHTLCPRRCFAPVANIVDVLNTTTDCLRTISSSCSLHKLAISLQFVKTAIFAVKVSA